MASKALSPMQLKFLSFAVERPIYSGAGHHPQLPAKGAVASVVATSLLRKGYIGEDGRITPMGQEALESHSVT